MLAKKGWFIRKKFGLGLIPVTWQGVAYLLVFILVFLGLVFSPDSWFHNAGVRGTVTSVWVLLLLADMTHVWFSLKEE